MANRRKTHEEFLKEVIDLVGDEYTVLTQYTLSKNEVTMRHNDCGNEFPVVANKFTSKGKRCPTCNPHKKRLTTEKFISKSKELQSGEYELLTPCIKSDIKVLMRHNVCGHEYMTTPNSFLSGCRCNKCFGNNARRKTHESFVQEVFELVGDDYEVLNKYENRVSRIKFRHKKCGQVHEMLAHNFLSGQRCYFCTLNDKKLTIEDVRQRVNNHLGLQYTVVGEYVNVKTKIAVRHDVCGHVFYSTISDIVYKHSSCKKCNKSCGETYVADCLTSAGVQFEEQKKFQDLKNINHLYYDFYIPSKGILIEYQGEQHYRPKNFGGVSKEEAIKSFEEQQLRDNIKRDYAKNNGYTLIELSYKLNSLEKVHEELKRLKVV